MEKIEFIFNRQLKYIYSHFIIMQPSEQSSSLSGLTNESSSDQILFENDNLKCVIDELTTQIFDLNKQVEVFLERIKTKEFKYGDYRN